MKGYPRKWQSDKFKREVPDPLKFGPDGKFKILHLTDIHNVEPIMDDDENREIPESRDKETLNVIETLVEKTEQAVERLGEKVKESGRTVWATIKNKFR